MKGRLEDKAAIVVGAGTRGEGIGNGKATAVQFAREGAKVLCVDLVEAEAERTAQMIRDEGGRAEVCPADIVKASDCRRVVETCLHHFHKIDILHNNVGVPSGTEIIDTAEETWDQVLKINLTGMFLMCKSSLPKMIEGGGGAIINVSTVASVRSFPDAVYSASKGAVNALTVYLAGRYARYNIRANALLLGFIDTPLARPVWENEKIKQINLRQVPMRRFASPWEAATAAAFLASDEASYITGVVLPVDGGLSIA